MDKKSNLINLKYNFRNILYNEIYSDLPGKKYR